MITVSVSANANASGAGAYASISVRPDLVASYQFPIPISIISRTITGILPDGRRLAHPLKVIVEYDDGDAIVSEPLFHMHAVAPTEAEALDAFKRILSGYLDSLTRREKALGSQLRDQLNYLRSIIVTE